MRSRSRGTVPPGFCISLALSLRGRGESRAPTAPAASRAKVKSTRVSHYRYSQNTGFPRAMVYGLLRALPGERLSYAHIFWSSVSNNKKRESFQRSLTSRI